MRINGSPTPMTEYATPQALEPESVTQARLAFDDVRAKFADAGDDLRAARQALVVAQADDIKEAAGAFAEGKEPKDLQKRERAAQAKIEELEVRRRALSRAVDEAGNALAGAIDDAGEEWMAALAEAEAEANAEYAEALAKAQTAAVNLRILRAALPWVGRLRPCGCGDGPIQPVQPWTAAGARAAWRA